MLLGGAILLGLLLISSKASAPSGQVAAVRTKLTRSQAQAYLRAALQTQLGRAPSAAELAMLTAQSALETGNWTAMWNWNWGNITTNTTPWFTLGQEKTVGAHKYRPFASPSQGASYYVAFLARRYPEAFSLLGSSNTVAFASALKQRGYFEADPSRYAAGLDSRYALG